MDLSEFGDERCADFLSGILWGRDFTGHERFRMGYIDQPGASGLVPGTPEFSHLPLFRPPRRPSYDPGPGEDTMNTITKITAALIAASN